jgi:hypothetical protein
MNDPEVRPEQIFSRAGPVDWVGRTFVRELGKSFVRALLPDRADGRDWMKGETIPLSPGDAPVTGPTDYWFDFIADTGDSQCSTYSLAYLLHGDLTATDPEHFLRADRPSLSAPLALRAESDPTGTTLRRGAFLFVGGDTAYPIANDRTIRRRFVAPFDYAHRVRFPNGAPSDRPLLGIPGNHDWYDNIDGFNRVFRREPAVPPDFGSSGATKLPRPLGYSTHQEASYFALELPGGWQLWALDARGEHDVDFRQRAFFRGLRAPERLIVATPLPPVARGTLEPWAPVLAEGALPAEARGNVKLWYSGDLHHYARYEGVEGLGPKPMTTLTSGLGSASMHLPTPGHVRAASVHPDPDEARREVIRRLFTPTYMLARQGLLVLGAAAGLMLAGATLEPTSEAASLLYYVVPRGVAGPTWTPAPPEVPWVLMTLVVSIFLLVQTIARARQTLTASEREARKHSIAKRIFLAGYPLVLLLIGGIVLAQSRQRTFGAVVLDFGFYIALLLLVVGAPIGLGLDWVKPPSVAQRFVVVVLGLTFGLVVFYVGVSSAHLCQRLLFGAIDDESVVFVASIVLTAFVTMLLFPIISGIFLAGAFQAGAQIMAISSIAAIDRHAAFIRFRLRRHPDGRSALTGFVVSVKKPVPRELLASSQTPRERLVPEAEIIDAFTVS